MNKIVLAKLGQYASAAIPLTWIAILHMLVLELFNNPHLELATQERRDVTKKVLVSGIMKLTVTGPTYILLLPTSAVPESTSLAATQLIYLMVTMTHNIK